MRIFIILLSFVFTLPLLSQGIIDEMAQLTCECMEAKDLKNKSSDEITNIMTDCLTQHLIKNITAFEEELNIEITDQEAMQAVGEKIGSKMATICPNIIMAIAGLSEDFEETVDETNTVSGKITSITGTDLTTLTIQTDYGVMVSFVWLGSFEGDEALIALKSKMIGTNVTVWFEELPIFNQKDGTYVPQNIITGISIN